MPRRYWLMKSEPDVYSIDDLSRDGQTGWEGVRNFQARNFMRDEMRVGDPVLFYHSNAQPPGVAGLAEVASGPVADPLQFRKGSEYFDPRSRKDDPTWMMVEVRFVEKFPRVVALDELKADAKLAGMLVLQRGQRLSVQPVSPAHFKRVVALASRR